MKNDTEENDAFQIDHVNTQKENDAWNKEEQKFTRKKNDTQRNSKRFQNNVNKRFQNDEANDTNKIRTEDLKITKSSHLL